ncbi:hypothetical protein PIB30_086944 [Stylosanthes scabra]|uniref:Uncharacterized protein n=1 Tax=Stylosanthes scabra TaxID=79078 RepID=A0ABU6TTT3_9FABA|nr:hypothetical protein [Stylosanthes scabra]
MKGYKEHGIRLPGLKKYHFPPANREDTLNSSFKGYSLSPDFVRNLSPEKIDALIDLDSSTRITSVQVQNVQNVDISGITANDNVCAQNTSNPINLASEGGNDLLVLLHNDSDLEDLVKVISETRAGSSQGVSLSEAKSIQQKQPNTPVSEKNAEIAK